jgi:carnitine O-acetyltransferase
MRGTITIDRILESHIIMAKADVSTRAPRGTKPVVQAFFSAVDAIPEASRSAVTKAALLMIRDEMKVQRDKMKATAVKVKAAAAKAKAATPKPAKAPKAAAPKAPPAKAAKPVKAKRTPKAKMPEVMEEMAPEPAPVEAAPEPAPVKRRGRKPAETPVAA